MAAERELLLLKLAPGNDSCCDCGAGDNSWASVTCGVFICLRCSGMHRALGTHISRVKSVTRDAWSEAEVAQMQHVGNLVANRLYERYVPDGMQKPTGNSPEPSLWEWIRAKYEFKQFQLPEPGSYLSPSEAKKRDKQRRKAEAPPARTLPNRFMDSFVVVGSSGTRVPGTPASALAFLPTVLDAFCAPPSPGAPLHKCVGAHAVALVPPHLDMLAMPDGATLLAGRAAPPTYHEVVLTDLESMKVPGLVFYYCPCSNL
jgi:hypothetical protein